MLLPDRIVPLLIELSFFLKKTYTLHATDMDFGVKRLLLYEFACKDLNFADQLKALSSFQIAQKYQMQIAKAKK